MPREEICKKSTYPSDTAILMSISHVYSPVHPPPPAVTGLEDSRLCAWLFKS